MQFNERETPGLWKRTFESDEFAQVAQVRDRFEQALRDMRSRASQLAAEIPGDLPEYTQHDVSHMDAIWDLADLIAGPEVRLNPAEGFVFGGAILVHDLAMSKAAHKLSGGDVRKRAEWPDALAAELRNDLGRAPHPSELASPPEEAARKAEKALLRELHAELAESLPLTYWESLRGDTVHLIGDPEIRSAYGRMIGQVAGSHHWNYDELLLKLSSRVGAPGFAPVDWKVDGLYLACLLRVSDAAHLDASRAPDLLAAVRDLPTESREHWLFQSRLQRPYPQNEKLTFTAPNGFSRDEMGAWWLAYDTLRMVDQELKSADTVLLSEGRQPFQVRGVAHIESPSSFAVVAECIEWEPIEARVKVGDVAGLVRRLGGAELYGRDWTVGLREIISNACDAVRAREELAAFRGGRRVAGRVTVWLREADEGVWLECSDNGIGMASSVLANNLLDFGCSSWLSPGVAKDNPGLIASRFEPNGKFGIGFFSVFMMGSQVSVTSRPLSGGPADTWILEFGEGVKRRPTLRKARNEEMLEESGTIVSVLLDEELVARLEDRVLLNVELTRARFKSRGPVEISSLLTYLLPAAQCEIWLSEEISRIDPYRVLGKDDWVGSDGYEFLCRIFGVSPVRSSDEEDDFDHKASQIAARLAPDLTVLYDEHGQPAGRVCLIDAECIDNMFSLESAIVTAGPARTKTYAPMLAGMLIGKPSRAARDQGVPVIGAREVAEWATLEAVKIGERLVGHGTATVEYCTQVAEQIRQLGGDADGLPVWRTASGPLNQRELVSWISGKNTVIVAHPVYADVRVGMKEHPIELDENVVVHEWSYREALSSGGWPAPSGDRRGSSGALIRAFVDAWGVEEHKVNRAARSIDQNVVVGRYNGEEIRGDCEVFDRNLLQND
ncbi:ATP-binding protein [Streptomyces sp. MA15]|uniref:HD domain-containing protein n=1 Tax=Streptomyces sp. MA15 TaxID=3055061 RepID=UPI0025B0FD5F|nr:ATP-binding protein [Streptomyces sp. MA15]MDN3268177.1 ATP-binding protein [Streptomyces sp. MA15]